MDSPARALELLETLGRTRGPVLRQQASTPLEDSPAHMECRVRDVIDRGDQRSCYSGVHIVLAEVVCITADDSIMAEPNRIDPTKVRAVGRMGFPWFVTVDEDSLFELERTRYADTALAGGG